MINASGIALGVDNSTIISWDQAIAMIALATSAFSIVFGVLRYRELQEFQERSINAQQRNAEFQKLVEAYKLVNNLEERQARKNIYDAYKKYYSQYSGSNKHKGKKCKSVNLEKDNEYDDVFNDPIVTDAYPKIYLDVERVRSTLDQIGSLFIYDLIPERPMLDMFWGTGRILWNCMEQDIKIERDKRKTTFYMSYFEHFYKEIENYRIEHNLPEVSLY